MEAVRSITIPPFLFPPVGWRASGPLASHQCAREAFKPFCQEEDRRAGLHLAIGRSCITDHYAGAAALAVKPIASAYLRYVSTEAITTRASTDNSSIPTRDTLAHTSITMPLSRIRSTTSARLDESVDFCTFAMQILLS